MDRWHWPIRSRWCRSAPGFFQRDPQQQRQQGSREGAISDVMPAGADRAGPARTEGGPSCRRADDGGQVVVACSCFEMPDRFPFFYAWQLRRNISVTFGVLPIRL